jgi:Kef-type K+ transport system membrane component KefB
MSIDPKLLLSNFPMISMILGLLIIGKTLLVTFVGRVFGVSTIAAIRVGLLLAPGGEFAFVAFGEAVNQVKYVVLFSFSRTTQESCMSFH